MVYTEDLMILLYDEAQESGMELEMVESLAKSNKISEEEVVQILIRNGCDVEKIMKKRGRPPKNMQAAEIKPVEIKPVEIKPVARPVATLVQSEPVKTESLETKVPDVVYELVEEKIQINESLIDEMAQKISRLQKEQEQLKEFIKSRCS